MILPTKLVASIIRDAVVDANNKEQEAAMFFFGKRAELLLTSLNLDIETVRQKLGLPAEWWGNTKNFLATATATTEPRIKLWQDIFGTDTIPLTTPAPFSVKTDKTNREGEPIYQIAYHLNTKALSTKQRYKLINYLAQTTHYTLEYIIKNIDDGLPIKAENIIVSIINNEKGVEYHNDYASRASTKTKKKKNSLANIAAVMKQQATQSPRTPIRMKLNGGLRLTLIYRLTNWQLSLIRENVYPSKSEINVCKKTFTIATNHHEKKLIIPHGGIDWHIIRLNWNSINQISFIDEGDKVVATVNHYNADQ